MFFLYKILNISKTLCAIIRPDEKVDGYGVPPSEFTIFHALALFLIFLGTIFLLILMIKLGIFLLNHFVYNDKNDDEI